MHYRAHSTKVKCFRWYFECASKRAGLVPPERYPHSVSGDSITTTDLAYPRRTCAAGLREVHGTVCVKARNN